MNPREEFLDKIEELKVAVKKWGGEVSNEEEIKNIDYLKSEFLKLFPENYQENEFLEELNELSLIAEENKSDFFDQTGTWKLLKQLYLETHKEKEG